MANSELSIDLKVNGLAYTTAKTKELVSLLEQANKLTEEIKDEIRSFEITLN